MLAAADSATAQGDDGATAVALGKRVVRDDDAAARGATKRRRKQPARSAPVMASTVAVVDEAQSVVDVPVTFVDADEAGE
jgi:hypothetical protein